MPAERRPDPTDSNPTLVVRLRGQDAWIGKDANVAARGPHSPDAILAAKWSHTWPRWIELGRPWPRPDLTNYDKGFLLAVEAIVQTGADVPAVIVTELVRRLREVTGS